MRNYRRAGKDDAGRETASNSSVWVRGGDEWWFEPANHDRIDLIPEKEALRAGETAKFQVRMPFREATVLVTVEREGVLSQRGDRPRGKSPVIEVPLIGAYGPNVFVSALAVRGRVDPEVPGPYAWLRRMFYRVGYWLKIVDDIPVERDTRPTSARRSDQTCLRLGMAEIKWGRREYALNVTRRETFRVRETARVSIQVTDSDGKPPVNGEIALAAVDEGLLELMDNASWNILEALMGERPVEVFTATAQGQVIGKRHFGKERSRPAAGAGAPALASCSTRCSCGRGAGRSRRTGARCAGCPVERCVDEFSHRSCRSRRCGALRSGAATVRTTQDLMLFSGLPPVVREQDEFNALFTLRNTAAQPVGAELAWVLRDRPANDSKGRALANGQQTVALAASEAKLVSVPVKVPVSVERLHWEVTATGKENAAINCASPKR